MVQFKGLPKPLHAIVDNFAKLPGVGPKSALRMALALLSWTPEQITAFGEHIGKLWDRLTVCSKCGGLADCDPCAICADLSREENLLCIVPEWDALLAMEEVGTYRGTYLILGGLLAPLDGINSSHLNIELLESRLNKETIKEVVLALGSTVEAEITSSFIKNLMLKSFPNIQITRLAQGIPLGADIKYVDKETLKQSLQYRQNI